MNRSHICMPVLGISAYSHSEGLCLSSSYEGVAAKIARAESCCKQACQ